jgi:hypothetical protein
MSKINVRSPYFITINVSTLVSATIKLRIYEGNSSTDITGFQYELTSSAINDSVSFEISELVRDYIENTFDGDYTNSAKWLRYEFFYTLGTGGGGGNGDAAIFDGYGYFSDGANPQNNQTVLQSNKTIYKYSDEPLRLPVHITTSTDFTFLQNGSSIYNTTLSTSTNSDDIIRYVSSESVAGVDSWQDRVVLDGGTVESLDCVKDFLEDIDLYGVDTVYVDNGTTVEVYNVENIEECLDTPYKLTFVNKFGALQDIWFFKRSTLSMNTTQQTYKSNLVVNGSYSINKHQKSILTKQGNESLTLNSGFYSEDNNEVFKQLFLSEQVWIDYDSETLPVNITSSNLVHKTRLKDKLISYEISLEFSNDTINNIR